MSWKIGRWREYAEGEIHRTLKRCLAVLTSQGFSVEVDFGVEKKPVEASAKEGGVFELLQAYEKQHGVAVLLELLTRDVVNIQATKDSDLTINMELILRCPEDSDQQVETFKEIVANWVKEDQLTFCERFIRLPKISEDAMDRYLDNPLEQVLRKTFGFHFKYKLLISSPANSPESEAVRQALWKIIAYS